MMMMTTMKDMMTMTKEDRTTRWEVVKKMIPLVGEHELRKALPEMTRTLKNWTVHGQYLGDMVECYRCNNHDYTPEQRSEIGHFFNTASNMLDTIGSMTEGSILRSVEFLSQW